MNDPVQNAMLVVQFLGLLGLVWYTIETHKMRKAAQKQVEISQVLIKTAMDQVEGLSKPCLTIWSDLRDPSDIILEAGRAVGNTVARGDQGSFVLQNIGNGVALNVSYRFKQTNDPLGTASLRHERYVQNVLASQKVTMVETLTSCRGGDYQIIFNYESIGGRKYRTTVTIINLVLTSLVFETPSS
jgi:hypothetical protein